MDFVTGPPLNDGYDAILVIVDRLPKLRHLIPFKDTAGAQEAVCMQLDKV